MKTFRIPSDQSPKERQQGVNIHPDNRGPAVLLLRWFPIAGMIAIAVSAIAAQNFVASVAAGTALIVFMVYFYVSPAIAERRRREMFKTAIAGDILYEFDDEGISWSSKTSTVKFSWSLVDRVIESHALYLFMLANGSSFCIVKKNVPSDEIDDFHALLAGRFEISTC